MRWFVVCCLFCVTQLFAASHHPNAFLEQVKGTKDEGEQIVQHFCGSCHASKPLIPLGAPRPRVEADWTPRLAAGLDALFQHANEGIRAMPPRGGCFECTDEQLWLAIKALLPPDTNH